MQIVLQKMQVKDSSPIEYYLIYHDNKKFLMNKLIGRMLTINHVGYQCLNCFKEKKIFSQGFCYDCFFSSPKAGNWIMRPELSTAHLNIEDRDLEYEKQVQLKPHIVYLALSSKIKVGITRKSQIPNRWIDQGASQAIKILEVPNRYLAGIAEVALKEHFADKTNWRKMLMNEVLTADLKQEKQKILALLPDEVKPYFLNDNHLYSMDFPVEQYPTKVKSLNLEKTKTYTGKLFGIKGQYLIFHDNIVFNVRSNEGKIIDFSTK